MREMPDSVATPVQADDMIAEKKRLALTYLHTAWNDAMAEGVDPDILAHAALFTALSDLIEAYGENAVAEMVKSLPDRVQSREFSPGETLH